MDEESHGETHLNLLKVLLVDEDFALIEWLKDDTGVRSLSALIGMALRALYAQMHR